MGRKVDPKTKTLYVYVRPEHREYVRAMKKLFSSESAYIDALIKKDMRYESLKIEMIKKIEQDAERGLGLLKGSKPTTTPAPDES